MFMHKLALFIILFTQMALASSYFQGSPKSFLYQESVSTATSNGTLTLTKDSTENEFFTGVLAHSVVLPNATTLQTYRHFYFSNKSTQAVTIKFNDSSTAYLLKANASTQFYLTSNGTSNGTWEIGKYNIDLPSEVSGSLGVSNGGSGLSTTPQNGQLLIGNGTGYSLNGLTAGTGVTITSGAGSITITASGSGGTVNTVNSGTGLLGGPITTSGTLSVDVGTTTGKIVQVQATNALPALDAFSLTGLNPLNISGSVGFAKGGTGLTALGQTDYLLGVNQAGSALEYKRLTAGTNITITSSAGAITINGSAGGVTSVSGASPVASTGGTTPVISLPVATSTVSGYLAATDWITFNNKQAAGSYALTTRNINTTSPLVGGGDLSADRTISMPVATSTVNGYLSSTDWITFNNKGTGTVTTVNSGTGLTGGPITTSGTLSVNVGTSVGQIVQVQAGSKLPVLDGFSLTGLNPANISGSVLAINGGTGQTTYTIGDLLYANSTTTLTKLPAGVSGALLQQATIGGNLNPAWKTISGLSLTNPAVTSYVAGNSGTYTVPASTLYLEVEIIGGGGGGGGGGTTGGTAGGSGGATTFGPLTANGGTGGIAVDTGTRAAGGTCLLGSATGSQHPGGTGNIGGFTPGTQAYPDGGDGGQSMVGGGGMASKANNTGNAGTTNSGGGASGGAAVNTANANGGGGGGAGCGMRAIINSPLSSYSYSVGSGGTAGTAGTNGAAGAVGGGGYIVITAHYQ